MPVANPLKELRALEPRLRKQGWTAQLSGEHPSFTSPEGVVVRTTGSSAGGRGWGNFLAALKRAGADLGTDVPPKRAQRARTRPQRQADPAPLRVTSRPAAVPQPPVQVVEHRHERHMEDVPERMAACRVLRHAWEAIGRGQSSFGVALVLACTRCGTTRRDLVQPWSGKVLSRQYVYAADYHVQGERPTMGQWRSHWVETQLDLPVLEDVVMQPPRKLQAAS